VLQESHSKKYLFFEVLDNIIANCGEPGEFVAGLNEGQHSDEPSWAVENNNFSFDGMNSGLGEIGGIQVTDVPVFKDAVDGDFTLSIYCTPFERGVGDPLWLNPDENSLIVNVANGQDLSEVFAVAKGETSTANVLCTPANAGVTVIEDETFTDVFSAYEMTVKAGSRELTFTSGNTSAIGYYNLSGDGLTLSYQLGAVRIENGETVTLSSTVNLQKGRITQLTLRSTPKGTITLSIIYDDTFIREDIEMIIDPEADRLETDAEQETDTQL
jgi:hypothetical protein